MKCVLPGQNAIVLARAIQSFARIGSELFLAANVNGLSLRTANLTKSAFAMILFYPDFFLDYNVQRDDDPLENQCKLSMKSCLGVFRNMKQVECCTITLDNKSFKLIVQYKCRAETIKTHHISILEQETLQAAYVTDNVPNILSGNYKIFSDIVTNFKVNEEELTIMASDKKIVAKNYVEGGHVDIRFVRSQLTLKPVEFEGYTISNETSITFCMRELRAILNFAEALNTNISMNFDAAGKPVVFIVKNFETFEANLVMSTLTPEDEENECQMNRTCANIPKDIERSQSNNNDESVQINDTDASPEANGLSIKRNRISSQRIPSESVVDVVRKKRKTLDTDSSGSIKSLPLHQNERISHLPHPVPDTESEEVAVVFQDESESISLLNNENGSPFNMAQNIDAAIASNEKSEKSLRDHRPLIRNVFGFCYSSGTETSENLGIVRAECSDEE